MKRSFAFGFGGVLMLVMACGGASQAPQRPKRATPLAHAALASDASRCETQGSDREVSEYDTSGDNRPDVR
ncbi:MAG: hypothetical protein N2515_02425, partial [Deltaproteobacteria bacterium]|nr:hypothetical protein [Deltaproteobacteria bacterium]